MKSFYSTTRSSAAQQGHTLVELLVAISLGSVVLAFLGGVLLVSEMRVSARIQRNLDAKDAANRAIDLIRREANFSSRIDYGDGSGTDSLKKCDNTPLILNQNNTSEICYKTVAPSQLLDKYKSAFEGPCVLVRLGPPYKPNGDIDGSPGNVVSPLLDGVSNTSDDCASHDNQGFTAKLASLKTRTDDVLAPPNRFANITFNMASGKSYSFSTRASSNLSYDGRDLFRNCNKEFGLCSGPDSAINHYLPENDMMNNKVPIGSESKDNFFYFKYPYSNYEINTGTCAYASCSVTVKKRGDTLKLERADVLIFPDKEIRPTR
jgi:prepilin-type N-terminal cleavage/methylation domain-containing protein